jgi:CheY-like chemotaxis protein
MMDERDRILIVDDNESARRSLRFIFSKKERGRDNYQYYSR